MDHPKGTDKPTVFGHVVSAYKECPKDPKHKGYEVRDYSEIWRDGNVHCAECGAFIRRYDAG